MSLLSEMVSAVRYAFWARNHIDDLKIIGGSALSRLVNERESYASISELEFKVFSQFGDDGIIQFLTHTIECPSRTFIEFGVADYFESNTRFLLQKDNWSGAVIDGSARNISRLKAAPFFWRHDLAAEAAFVTRDNIAALLAPHIKRWGCDPDLLHIDLDGNDYWVWEALDVRPLILILEYNGTFGIERPITIPYDPGFLRTKAHHSNSYWGASLRAFHDLSVQRGYAFLGCNSAGNNAYFVRSDVLGGLNSVDLRSGFVEPKFRESRDKAGALDFLTTAQRRELIRGMPVFNIETGKMEPF